MLSLSLKSPLCSCRLLFLFFQLFRSSQWTSGGQCECGYGVNNWDHGLAINNKHISNHLNTSIDDLIRPTDQHDCSGGESMLVITLLTAPCSNLWSGKHNITSHHSLTLYHPICQSKLNQRRSWFQFLVSGKVYALMNMCPKSDVKGPNKRLS